MMKKRTVKALALGGILALCLGLSGCYIPPDDLSGDVSNIGVGSNNLPYQTVSVPTDTPVPTATPTAAPAGAFGTDVPTGSGPQIDWNDGVTGSVTGNGTIGANQPGVGTTAGTGVGVNPGVSTTIGVTTQNPGTTRPTVTATPAPSSLKNGSKGSAVKSLQQRLKELGYYSGSVDGDFGDATEAAVRAFQKQNGLTVDGKAGTKTITKLNSSSAVRAPSATATPTPKKTATPTPRKTTAPTPRATSTPNLSKDIYLRDGSTGSDVKRLQERLISLGWLTGTADSTYGGATEAAVIAFQKKTSGLYEDGVAGPDTLRALYSSNAAKSSTPAASVGVKLQTGSEGEAVRALQRRLRTLGYLSDSVDGTYGEKTRAAVIAFQTNMGLKVDGIAGTDTLNAIFSQDTPKASEVNRATEAPVGSSGDNVLREGDTGSAVTRLQQALKNLGYYTGAVDGNYGSGTVEAVKSFQRQNGLRIDGKAGEATQRALYGTSSTASYNTLRPGDEGSAVTNLQYALYELGYYDGRVDGIYSTLTSEAVRAFQQNNSLKVDGIAGEETQKKLYSSSARAAGAADYTTLRQGDQGHLVIELQEALQGLGYLAQVTGVYDDATYWAVKSFQERNGLQSDGAAGTETLTRLYSGSAVSAY